MAEDDKVYRSAAHLTGFFRSTVAFNNPRTNTLQRGRYEVWRTWRDEGLLDPGLRLPLVLLLQCGARILRDHDRLVRPHWEALMEASRTLIYARELTELEGHAWAARKASELIRVAQTVSEPSVGMSAGTSTDEPRNELRALLADLFRRVQAEGFELPLPLVHDLRELLSSSAGTWIVTGGTFRRPFNYEIAPDVLPSPYSYPSEFLASTGYPREVNAAGDERRRGAGSTIDLHLALKNLDPFEADIVQELLTTKLASLISAARQSNAEERVEQLIRAIAPADPLAAVELKVAESTVSLRRDFLEQVPVLTSTEVHTNAGFPGSNPSQTVHRWRKAGKIFSISHAGRELYPAFQFGDDGKPLPVLAEVLTILNRDSDRSDWDNALWFAGESGWLDGAAPKDCLQSDPEGVKRAAEQEVLRDER